MPLEYINEHDSTSIMMVRVTFAFYFGNIQIISILGSAVVECLTLDREAAGSSLTGVPVMWSLSKTHLS